MKPNKRKFKSPNTIAELQHQLDLGEMAEFLANPKNKIRGAIVITVHDDGLVRTEVTEEVPQVVAYGMLEVARDMLNENFYTEEGDDNPEKV